MPTNEYAEFSEFWKWTILVTIDQLAANNYAIAHEMFFPVISNFDKEYADHGYSNNSPMDDMAAIAVLVNTSLIYLGLNRVADADNYVSKLATSMKYEQMDKVRMPYYYAIKKFIDNGYTAEEIPKFASLAAAEFRQIYASIP